MSSTAIRRRSGSSLPHRAAWRQRPAVICLPSSSGGTRRTGYSSITSSSPFAPARSARSWRWRSHRNSCGSICRGIRRSSASTRTGTTSMRTSYSTPSISSQERSIIVVPRATTSRSVASQTGSAGRTACPSSCPGNRRRRSAMWNGCGSPRGSPPSAPCWRRTFEPPSRTPTTWVISSC